MPSKANLIRQLMRKQPLNIFKELADEGSRAPGATDSAEDEEQSGDYAMIRRSGHALLLAMPSLSDSPRFRSATKDMIP
jgi:hypothetical protein